MNKLITLMGQSVLRKLLCRIKNSDPNWFAIIVDETADVARLLWVWRDCKQSALAPMQSARLV